MTAVPAQRNKTKDPFQVELGKEIERRKERGLKTGFTDDEEEDDDYPDDFLSEDSDDDFLKEYSKAVTPLKKSSYSTNNNATFKQKELKNFLKDLNSTSTFATRKSPRSPFGRQQAVDDTRKSLENNPLFSVLEEDSQPSESSTEKRKNKLHHPGRPSSPSIDSQRMRLRQSGKLLEETLLSPRSQTSVTGKEENTLSSQSVIDQLLSNTSRPQPKPRMKATTDDEDLLNSYTRSRHSSGKSTTSVHSEKQKSVTSPRNDQLKSIENTTTPKETSQLDFLKSLPSLEPKKVPRRMERSLHRDKPETRKSMKELEKDEANQSKSPLLEKPTPLQAQDKEKSTSADDLLALFEQTAVSDNALHDKVVESKKIEIGITEPQTQLKSPTEVVAEKTADEALENPNQYRSSQHLITNVIDNVADHNETYILNKDEIDAKEQQEAKEAKPKRPSSSRPKSSLKSPRRPPSGYKGLGSLSSLQQLQTYKSSSQTLNLNSTADIRNSAYMDWLADREKKLREKKKQKLEEEEKENEKKEKEIRDKYLEAESARRAWMEHKEGLLKEEVKKKKRQEKRKREEALRAEEEKWKSEKKADVVRERALAEAKKRHREELKKKREEELLQKRKEKDKKKENEKAYNEWKEKRSTQWEKDRRKEMMEKKKKEREVKEAQEKKSKEGRDTYAKWHEEKEQHLRETRRIKYHEEERPPWSPPNKVIPRQR